MAPTTTGSSRSSSPSTPDSDDLALQVDLSAWCHSFSPDSDMHSWDPSHPQNDFKLNEDGILMLDDVIREGTFEPVVPDSLNSVNPSVFQLPQQFSSFNSPLDIGVSPASDNSSCEGHPIPDLLLGFTPAVPLVTKVVPPPPAQTRKCDHASSSNRVVHPPRDTCSNLAILTPSIPSTGTKSRVETQVRVQLDLAHASCSSGDPLKYDRVGSWKWLRLPKGTATRKRSRKEGKIDATPADTLNLNVEVACSSTPSTRVVTCSTCQRREAKRVARKIAARIRPARSDSENECGQDVEEKVNIIQFNCADTLDFSSGSVILPLRITCYCRHHREKQGFNVHFTMSDETGRIVGKGMSPPIMITDDHKSTGVNAKQPQSVSFGGVDGEWDAKPVILPQGVGLSVDTGAPSKRRQQTLKEMAGSGKKRAKPYDNGRPLRADPGRENPYSRAGSAMLYPESASTSQYGSAPPSVYGGTAPPSPRQPEPELATGLPSPISAYASPTNSFSHYFDNDILMRETGIHQFLPPSPPCTAPSSPPANHLQSSSSGGNAVPDFSSIGLTMLGPQPDPPFTNLPAPKIHRLIPSSGPIFGGIEVTVLGSNFHSSVLYNCVFGDVVASSTSRWSDNTLVCVLPPRACPGVVPVTLQGIKMEEDPGVAPVHFTYTDESDRALMELALQVVGLKMTGNIEDAKKVAMRIVGATAHESQSDVDAGRHMNITPTSAALDPRRLLLSRTGDGDFEKVIIDFLSVLDVPVDAAGTAPLARSISHKCASGQTLLHLAAFLRFPALIDFLVQHDIDLDARDANGFTALHCAALVGASACMRVLVDAGADPGIVDARGRSAAEVAPRGVVLPLDAALSSLSSSDDEDQWGDGEESGAEEFLRSRPPSRASRRRVHRLTSRRASRPSSEVASDASEGEDDTQTSHPLDDDDAATVVAPDHRTPDLANTKADSDGMLEKQAAASLAAMFQRAWTQLQPPHLMPQMPQLPGVPAWVFPVFVPMPGWPAFLGEKNVEGVVGEKGKEADGDAARSGYSDIKASLEKWAAMMSAGVQAAQVPTPVVKVTPPPVEMAAVATAPIVEPVIPAVPVVAPVPTASRSLLRRFGYGTVQITDQEVDAYAYKPARSRTLLKKEDRMLVLFWIPILLLAIGWALYSTMPLAFSSMRHFLPFTETVGTLHA